MTGIELPDPITDHGPAFAEVLNERKSVRSYSNESLVLKDLSQLLWAGQGTTHASTGKSLRTAPSSGAHHPFTVYCYCSEEGCLGLKGGLYRYHPRRHHLTLHKESIASTALADVFAGQQAISDTDVIFILAADPSDSLAEYPEKGEQFVLMEAGHIGQNILLMATALGIGSCPVGLFPSVDVNTLFDLPDEHDSVYAVPVGPLPVN